ncbi:Ctr copper transporter [Pyrrhoderma noxium]|uniref:Copper transport protein n=1 Tax=Pyrrhoderma noxium TaxID=2282107 RepID=A0A286UHE7_9AGAM|nr:Ctr copper transporter [Pyrrhoderma noxium]
MPGMEHGDHGGHDGMDMGGKCSMNMLWNTQIIDTCVVFPQWHIRSHYGFFLSFLAIVALGIFYEWLRASARTFDRRVALKFVDGKGKGRNSSTFHVPHFDRALRAILYGATVFLSFFLMLVFMTYNAYLILAVVLGAAIGHYYLGGEMNVDAVLHSSDDKGMACH